MANRIPLAVPAGTSDGFYLDASTNQLLYVVDDVTIWSLTAAGVQALVGALTVASLTATGAVAGASGSFTGAVAAASAALTGALTAASATATGAVQGATVTATTGLSAPSHKVASGSLTAAQIKALRAAPHELVPAPAAGKVLEFVSLTLKLEAGSEALTETDDNLVVRYTDGSGTAASNAIESTGWIDQVADAYTIVGPAAVLGLATAFEAQALVLHNTGDGEIAGNVSDDAAIDFEVVYRVHTL